ncbi:MAG: type II CAAX endopeptidase family protein [Chlamydiota bacterium]
MISTVVIAGWFLLALSLLSVWIRREPRVWGTLLTASLIAGFVGGNLLLSGIVITIGWATLWMIYIRKQKPLIHTALFVIFIVLSFGFEFHLLPGFPSVAITPHFSMGFMTPLLGLFPHALLVPLAKSVRDWKQVMRGTLLGCVGIALLATVAILSGAVHLQFKLPSFAGQRFLSNLIFTAIPEEAFYRGFLQTELCRYFKKSRAGNFFALLVSTLIFTLAHAYWSPSLDILGFVFLAGLLYGYVYQISGKIESAILCHFLLNFIHMTFFSYHAM